MSCLEGGRKGRPYDRAVGAGLAPALRRSHDDDSLDMKNLATIPVVRSQSGTPYARTFVRTLNYGNATIKAEPIDANHTPAITLVDLRTEKTFRAGTMKVMGFFDIYNIFNTNAEQTVTTNSGASWLRPIAITGPRILRIGARFEW